jgi:flagellar basal-body rod modification protein FlgD
MSDLIPIGAVTDPTWGRPAAAAQPGDTLGKDAFLKLLVAQLKYQNPMSPSDPNQFMAQTAQFTMVEKLEQLAQEATRQRAVTESGAATALLGRTVAWTDADGEERSGVVTGTSFGTEGATLHVGQDRIPLELIRSVTQ